MAPKAAVDIKRHLRTASLNQQQQQQLLPQKLLRACVRCVAACVMKIGEDCLWQ